METRKPSSSVVATAEYRLLNALVKNTEFLNDARVTESIFTDQTAKSIFEAIQNLYEQGLPITPMELFQAGSALDFTVKQDMIQTIFDIEPNGVETLDGIIPTLETENLKVSILEKLDGIRDRLKQTGDIDANELLESLYEVDGMVTQSGKAKSDLLSIDQWADIYLDDLEQRKDGRKYSYGDLFLDQFFFKGAYPGAITTVAASTSMGKSTYVLTLIDNLLEMNTPCMYLSLEMGAIDTFDRLIAKRCSIRSEDLYNREMMDDIIEQVRKEKGKLANRGNFGFCENPNIDMVKLKALIREFKQRTHNDYAFVAIDLLTQMKNFMIGARGSSTASAMEMGMNQLNAIAKEENVHILAVVQFKRDSDSVKIHSVDEINLLRPTLTDIKNSGAIAERSRVVLSVFRKKYYADRYLVPFNVPGAEDVPDLMEVQVLKNSNGGSAGKIFKYMYDSDYFKLLPVMDEDERKMNAIEDNIQPQQTIKTRAVNTAKEDDFETQFPDDIEF